MKKKMTEILGIVSIESMEEIERIIRKRWFAALCLGFLCATYVGGGLESFSFENMCKMFKHFFTYDNFDYAAIAVVSYLLSIFNCVGFVWAYFYFPYVRKGTKFLMFTIILNISTFGFWSFQMFKHPKTSLLGALLLLLYQISSSVNLYRVNLIHKLKDKGKFESAEKITEKLKKRFKKYAWE
jgi:hypothetical protein